MIDELTILVYAFYFIYLYDRYFGNVPTRIPTTNPSNLPSSSPSQTGKPSSGYKFLVKFLKVSH